MRTRTITRNALLIVLTTFLIVSFSNQTKAQCTANYSITYVDCSTITVYDSSTVATGDTIDYINLDWGDGTATYNLEPNDFPVTHWYGATGTYTYGHFIATTQGCVNSTTSPVTISDPPTANFTSDTSCAGSPTQFTDLSISTGSPLTSWAWDFGDGGTSSVQNPVHTYTFHGVYTTCLTVTNVNGCVDSTCHQVAVTNSSCLLANFSTISPICEGDSMCFIDQSIANGTTITNWLWNFGDGGISTDQNPCHLYSTPGTFNVTLIITDNLGGIDSTTMLVEMLPNPVANFAYNANCDYEVDFTDLSIHNATSITSWAWDFGDGGSSTAQNPTYIYPGPGSYNVCLTVVNNNGCIDSTCGLVNPTNMDTSLVAEFTAPDSSCVGFPVLFEDMSWPCTAINSWDWDFGDGNTGTGQNVTHTYLAPGVYSVTLTVTADSVGITITDDVTHPITIYDGPEADFTFDNGECPWNPVQFTSYTSIPVVSYFWEFGDGDTSTLQHPSHSYQAAGDYIVSLSVTDANGCTDMVQYTVNIYEPDADFSYSPTDPNPGDTVFFTDLSTSPNGYITQWVWYFGDGDSTTVNFPDNPDVWHVYSDSGNFIVELYVVDSEGCSGFTTQNVLVFAGTPIYPIADFTYTLDCLNNPVLFTDLSTSNGGSPLQSWWWEFGDGGTSANQNPAYTYSSAGTYDVSLVVTNVDNLSDTVVNTVTTLALPLVSITAVSPNAQTGEAIQFYGTPINGTIVSWNWDFGDGNTAVTQNPVHTYLNQGNYTVTLTVVDTSGCTNSISMQVIIYSPPVFPEDSTIWNVVGDNSLTNQTWRFRYGLIGDTTIGTTDLDTSYIYSKVFSLYDSTLSNPNSTYFGALRTTEDKKVYVQLPGFEEALLYDFSLEVGDTIWYAIGGSLCYNSVVFTSEEHYKVVTATDSILIENGETRKWWSLTDYPNGMTDTWVDGIGSIVWYGLFNPLINNITLCGDGYSFACMKEGDEIVYLNNPHCEECFCQLMTALEENDVAEDDILHIYPNPANDHLIVESSEKIDGLRIIDMTGNTWFNAQVDNNNIRISTRDLTNGVYIIEARSEDGFYKKKFVIYHP